MAIDTCIGFTTSTEIYKGHDNVITIVPYSNMADMVNYDMTGVSEVTVSADLVDSVATGDDITASSTDFPVTVWYVQDIIDGETLWVINIKVGLFVGILAGEYKLRVVIIEPGAPNGLVIADDLLVTVVEVP